MTINKQIQNMKQTIKLTESELKRMISESIKKVLNERKYINDAIYIVFDGSSHYGVYGCDVEDEILNNDVEVVKGPFAKWDDKVEQIIEDLNDEAMGKEFDRRRFYESKKRHIGNIVKESIKKVLNETSIFTDDPYHNAEYNTRDERWEDYPEGKEGDIEYSWDEYDKENGNLPIQDKNRRAIMNANAEGRRFAQNWTPRQLKSAEKMKKKWISGEKDLDDLDDAFYGSSL